MIIHMEEMQTMAGDGASFENFFLEDENFNHEKFLLIKL